MKDIIKFVPVCTSRKPNGEYLTGLLLFIYESENDAHFVMEMRRLFCAEKGTAIWKEGRGKILLKRRRGE